MAVCLGFLGVLLAERSLAGEVERLFAQHCLECHGPDKQKGDLRLDVENSVQRVAGDGTLLRRLTTDDPEERMPLERPGLPTEQIATIRSWIDAGAHLQGHWAYGPLREGPLPVVEGDDGWVRNGIDRFVLAGLKRRGVEPSPEADRYTLIKRLYYDLIGLPPAPEEVDAFVSDPSPTAYRDLVRRLLASKHFGERWGRHWLDKARYADSDGYEKDRPRPHAWHYRDWVIEAINADMPMGQFTMEQLAGDLLPEASESQRLATAFHRQTLTNTEGGTDQEQFRVEAVFDRTETTGAIWLGLTMNCARCHNHKYDALTQREYYQLFAFFNCGEESKLKLASDDLEGAAGNEEEGKKKASKDSVREVRVISHRPRDTRILRRGDFLSPEAEVSAAGLGILPPVRGRAGDGTPLDRLDLARWLMSEENPLTPRVLANHVWEKLFGHGLVRTMNDFGVRGEAPTHPGLLDWLGAEYRRGGWSRKRLIETIVLSATYRQQSAHREDLVETDPNNRWLARQNRFRVEGEIVRDVCLSVAGLLSREIGGPSVFPPMPPEVAALSYANSFKWENSVGEDRYRRGMYTFFKRTAPHPNLMAFDCPDSNTASLKRRTSNTPIQALTTLNNEIYLEAAQALAKKTLMELGDGTDAERVTAVLRRCLARWPEEREVESFLELLETSRAFYRDHGDEASKLVGAYQPETTDAAEAASWVTVCRIALNLDELITRE